MTISRDSRWIGNTVSLLLLASASFVLFPPAAARGGRMSHTTHVYYDEWPIDTRYVPVCVVAHRAGWRMTDYPAAGRTVPVPGAEFRPPGLRVLFRRSPVRRIRRAVVNHVVRPPRADACVRFGQRESVELSTPKTGGRRSSDQQR